MVGELFGLAQRCVLWLSSRPNHLRVRGARIEVVALVLTSDPAPAVLLARSRHDAWLPPQEGVGLQESFEEALYRCLRVECGLDIPEDRHERERVFYIRLIRYARVLDLPRERWGERLIADDCLGTPLESITMRRKAYSVATVLVRSRDAVAPRPDGSEVVEVRWCELAEAEKRIRDSNRPEKAALLVGALRDAAGRLQKPPSDPCSPRSPSPLPCRLG